MATQRKAAKQFFNNSEHTKLPGAGLYRGKEFTGIELSPHYYQVALERLKEATKKRRD